MPRRAFTLVELLVVIAIIALLISILVPSLAKAREAALAVTCTSNARQLAVATHTYADDHDASIWPNLPNSPTSTALKWARAWDPSASAWAPGPVYDYLDNAHEVLACPKNRRRSTDARDHSVLSDYTSGDVDFDFTFVNGVQGARTDLPGTLHFVDRINKWTGGKSGSYLWDRQTDRLSRFRRLPVFVEESSVWYNSSNTDGLWGNLDQISPRHAQRGQVVLIDATVELFPVASGTSEDKQENKDFVANDLFLKVQPAEPPFYALNWWNANRAGRHGWINQYLH